MKHEAQVSSIETERPKERASEWKINVNLNKSLITQSIVTFIVVVNKLRLNQRHKTAWEQR